MDEAGILLQETLEGEVFQKFPAVQWSPGCLWSFTRRVPKVTPGNLELATPGKAATGSPPWAAQMPSSKCACKWDLSGGSPSGQEQVGGHVLTWGPVTITPEDGLLLGK